VGPPDNDDKTPPGNLPPQGISTLVLRLRGPRKYGSVVTGALIRLIDWGFTGTLVAGASSKKRVLLVEDNVTLALALQRLLEHLGYAVIGPVHSADEGLTMASCGDIDAAILDLSIVGGNSLRIAEALRIRGCPFLFTTGDCSPSLDERWDVPVLLKPVGLAELDRGVKQLLEGATVSRRDGD